MDDDIQDAVDRKLKFDTTEKNIGDATLQGLLVQSIRNQTKETERLTSESNSLQKKIYWLTFVIVLLTIVLILLGVAQFFKSG